MLITDYAGDDEETQELATRLAAHNDVLAVLVYDPLGIQLPGLEGMHATDGSEQLQIPSDAQFTNRFEDVFRQRVEQIRERLRAIRIPILPLCTHEPVAEQVRAALGERR